MIRGSAFIHFHRKCWSACAKLFIRDRCDDDTTLFTSSPNYCLFYALLFRYSLVNVLVTIFTWWKCNPMKQELKYGAEHECVYTVYALPERAFLMIHMKCKLFIIFCCNRGTVGILVAMNKHNQCRSNDEFISKKQIVDKHTLRNLIVIV